MINPKMFKMYDIRGIYPTDLNKDVVYKIGRAYSKLIKSEVKKSEINIVVGQDMRASSPELSEALINGITDEGLNVVDIGLSSTPTFYFAVAKYGYDGGIVVTASHNPSEYNGFKMTRARAVPVSGLKGIFKIRDMVIKNDFGKISEKKGQVSKKENVLKDHIKDELKYVDIHSAHNRGGVKKIKPLKVVADVANGMGALFLDELFKYLPCKLIRMNFKLDGSFPAHEADPLKNETMDDLKKKVVKEKADLGIATDGDGDRVFFVTDKGKTLYQPITRGLIAQSFLKDNPGATVCYDIRPGKITREMILSAGGKPVITKAGHSLIKEKVIETGAIFSGESSGHFFVKVPYGVYETPMIVILKILELISQKNKPFSEIIKPYEKYYASGEINSIVKDVKAKLKELEEKYQDAKINKLDGITIEYPNFWFNVRPSNTEPKLRLNLEAVSKEIMEEKRDEILKLIRS